MGGVTGCRAKRARGGLGVQPPVGSGAKPRKFLKSPALKFKFEALREDKLKIVGHIKKTLKIAIPMYIYVQYGTIINSTLLNSVQQ